MSLRSIVWKKPDGSEITTTDREGIETFLKSREWQIVKRTVGASAPSSRRAKRGRPTKEESQIKKLEAANADLEKQLAAARAEQERMFAMLKEEIQKETDKEPDSNTEDNTPAAA